MTLAMAVLCYQVRQTIGPRSVAFSTLGGGGSTVCGTLYLVRRATVSYFSLVDGNLGADGDSLGVCMTTIGSEVWV